MSPGGAARALAAHAPVHLPRRGPLRARRLRTDGLFITCLQADGALVTEAPA